jgi:hypothetical protein
MANTPLDHIRHIYIYSLNSPGATLFCEANLGIDKKSHKACVIYFLV